MLRRAVWLVLVSLWCAPALAEPEESALEEAIRVTATRFEKELEETGATVTVIPAQEWEARQVVGAARAIQTVPGARVSLGGPPGSPSSFFFRGAGSNQTLVLIDGIPLNDPTLGGQFNPYDLTVDGIERIEVLRGSASTLYGSDAIGGVVNLVTKPGGGEPGATITTEGGSFGYYRGRIAAFGSKGLMDFDASISKLRILNDLRNNEFTDETYAGRVGFHLPYGLYASLSGRYIDADADDPWEFPFGEEIEEDDNISRERNTTLGALSIRQDVSDAFTWEMTGAILDVNSLYTNGPDSGGDPVELRSRAEAQARSFGVTGTLYLPEVTDFADVTFLGGFDYRDEISESRVTSAFGDSPDLDTTVRNRAAFLLAEVILLKRLTLSGGLRRERNTYFGWETTATASALYHVVEWDTRIRANYGEGIRAPKPVEFNDPFIGNPDLDTEESQSIDIGVSQVLLDGVATLDVTWFRLRVDDLIAYDPDTFRLENFHETRTTGWELALSVTPVDGLLVRGWWTRQKPRDLDADKNEEDQLPGRPEWFGGGEVRYTADRFSASIEVQASGDYPGTTHTTPDGDRRNSPGRKLVFALRGAYDLAEGITLRGRIENLFDTTWYDDTTRPDGLGRGAYLGLDFTF